MIKYKWHYRPWSETLGKSIISTKLMQPTFYQVIMLVIIRVMYVLFVFKSKGLLCSIKKMEIIEKLF